METEKICGGDEERRRKRRTIFGERRNHDGLTDTQYEKFTFSCPANYEEYPKISCLDNFGEYTEISYLFGKQTEIYGPANLEEYPKLTCPANFGEYPNISNSGVRHVTGRGRWVHICPRPSLPAALYPLSLLCTSHSTSNVPHSILTPPFTLGARQGSTPHAAVPSCPAPQNIVIAPPASLCGNLLK